MVARGNNRVGKHSALIPICYNIEFLPNTCKKECASWGLRFDLPDNFANWIFFI